MGIQVEQEVSDTQETVTPKTQAEPEKQTAKPNWFDEMIDREIKNDRIVGGALVGEIVAFVFISALLSFFVAHELNDTGFYTDEFGGLEKFMLFGAGGFAVSLIGLRIIIRRKNLIRPLDAASLMFFVAAHAILLAVFPFDFAYVGDAMPRFLAWTVDWISDSMGAILLGLGVVGGSVGIVFTLVTYVNVRKRLEAIEASSEGPSSG
jgi:hypothetical protein